MALDIFQLATKNKYRFESPTGLLSVEDLWGLPLTTTNPRGASLDGIASELHKQINSTSFSLINETSATDTVLKNKFEIVKFIVEDRKAANEAVRKAKATKEHNQKIMDLIARKQDQGLEQLTVEQLQALLDQA